MGQRPGSVEASRPEEDKAAFRQDSPAQAAAFVRRHEGCELVGKHTQISDPLGGRVVTFRWVT